MATQPTKLQRWLDVIAYLAGRRLPGTVEQLWEAVPAYEAGLEGDEKAKQTVRRMFERDKDELRGLGIPIETVPYSIHFGREQTVGYRLGAQDFHLPYLRLVAEARGGSGAAGGERDFPIEAPEARAALEGLSELSALPAFPLRTSARSAFRKLAFDLDPGLAREAPVVYAEDPETAASREPLRLLSDAVQRRKAVRFGYRGMTRDTDEARHVEPYGLLFQHGRWYLVGRDVDQDGKRMFRLGRMRDVALVRGKKKDADYEVPEGFSLADHAGRAAWEIGEDTDGPVEADVWFAFPRSLWAERNEHGTLVGDKDDGSQLRRFRVLRRDPFLRWVLSLAGDARVVAPEPLARAFTELVTDVMRRYAEPEHP
ncbi:MAG: WYL domain-containing protein [Gemmatimonadota bacterium]